jgi:hypothetical protein
MGILANLDKTNLKSLRYGRDKIGGGSSNQPYITKPIPSGEQSLGNTGGPDFLLRGGTLAITNTADDVSRLTKMFFDTKSFNGFGFIAKQNLLSRTGVKTQAGGQEIYLPTNTLAQAGVSAFGLHFYKQGLNPIPLPSNDNIISLGPLGAISPTGNIISYSQVVKPGNTVADVDIPTNRLFQLYENKILGIPVLQSSNITSPSDTVNIFKYGGGPGSILGIGPTYIKFSDQRTGVYNVYGKDIVVGKYQTQRWNGRTVNSFLQPSLIAPIGFKYIDFANISSRDEGKYLPLITKSGSYTWEPNFNISVYNNGTLNPNPEKIGSETWTPNQDLANGRIWSNLATNVTQYTSQSVTQKYSETNGIGLSIPTNDQRFVYKGPVGVNGELYGNDRPGWTPNQSEALTEVRKFTRSNKQNYSYVYAPFPGYIRPSSSLEYIYGSNSTKTPPSNTIVTTQANLEVLSDINKPSKYAPKLIDFRKGLKRSLMTPLAPNYETKNIEQRVFLGNPGGITGNKTKINYDFNVGKTPWKNALDKITAMPIYQSEAVTTDDGSNDLVKFRIAIIDNDDPSQKVFIHFRAFIDSFSDSYSATWNGSKLLGRGEDFYTYGGFTRKISLGWTMAAQSKQELIPIYQKLNYLASTLTPDFSKTTGYMRGNLAQLTVGGYLYEQPGIIEGLTYTIEESSPWEIGIDRNGESDNNVKELGHIIKVTGFSFTPIHEFIPRKQDNNYNGTIGNRDQTASTWGKERYISLDTGTHNNYDDSPIYIPQEENVTDIEPTTTDPPPVEPPQPKPTPGPGPGPGPGPRPKMPGTDFDKILQDNTYVAPQRRYPAPLKDIKWGGGRFGGAGSGGNFND